MEEGNAETLSLLCFERKKTFFFGDLEPNDCEKVLSDETVGLMVDRERQHLPNHDYLKRLRSGDFNISFRKEAYDCIKKTHAYFGFGPWSFFLAVNYMDRFLSNFEIPGGKSWIVQLLALACLSIAAKMGETKVPKSVGFQVGDPKFAFDAKSIERMELVVLNTLGWKMQALTPCSFIDYFISKITNDEEHHTKSSWISESIELMLNITNCIDFLEFKPSEIAAAVAISVTSKLQAEEIHKALSCLVLVKEERVLKCLEVMKDLLLIKVSANLVVVDGACASSKSDECAVISSSATNSSIDNPNTKIQSNGPSDETCKPYET